MSKAARKPTIAELAADLDAACRVEALAKLKAMGPWSIQFGAVLCSAGRQLVVLDSEKHAEHMGRLTEFESDVLRDVIAKLLNEWAGTP